MVITVFNQSENFLFFDGVDVTPILSLSTLLPSGALSNINYK